MKRLYLLLLILPTLFIACESDTVPITTTSEKARQEYLIARDLFEKLQYQDAVQYLEKAIEYDSTFALAYLYLSNTGTNVTERIRLLEMAKSLSDQVSKGERLCILAYEAGVYGYSKKQEAYFQELVEMYPNDEWALNHLANYYFSQREYDKAMVYYKGSIQLNPKFSIAYNQLGYIFRYQGNFPAAEESFKKYIKLVPDDPNPYDSYAELLLKMGEYEVSIETYEKALEIDPDFIPSHLGVATNLIYMRKYQKARAQLKHMYKIAREDVQRINAHFGMAVSYLAEGDVDNCLSEIENLYHMAEEDKDVPSMVGNLYTMAVILYDNNRLEEAQKKLDESWRLQQSEDISEGIKNNLGRGYWYRKSRLALIKNNFEDAAEYAETYREKVELTENPRQMMYYYTLLGLINMSEKDYSKAISDFEKTNLEDPFNRFQLAQAYVQNGDKDKAIDELEYVVKYNDLMSLNYTMVRGRAEKQLGYLKMN